MRWLLPQARPLPVGIGHTPGASATRRDSGVWLGNALRKVTQIYVPVLLEKLLLSTQSSSKTLFQPSWDRIQFNLQFTISTPEKLESVPEQTNGQHQEAAKIYGLYGLDECLNEQLFDEVHCLFGTFPQRIQQLGLSTEKCDHPRNTRDRLDLSASWSKTAIELTIRWVNGSELDLVQQRLRWPDQLQEIDCTLENLVTRTYLRTQHKIQSRRAAGKSVRKYPSESALQMAESLIPVIKLSRLFFSKASHRAINRDSSQLEALTDSATYSAFDLDELHDNLLSIPSPRDFSTRNLTTRAQHYKTRLESAMFLIILYFPPEDFRGQDPNKAWFLDWYTASNQTISRIVFLSIQYAAKRAFDSLANKASTFAAIITLAAYNTTRASHLRAGATRPKTRFHPSDTLCIRKGVDIQSSKTSDQHDEEVKILRLSGLDKLLRDMVKELRSVFRASSGLICQLGLSMVRCDHLEKVIDTWDRLVGDISRSDHAIHRTIVWLEGSELELVQQDWPINLDQIDVILIDITKRANPAINKEKTINYRTPIL
ncbi:hypothetical protein KEM48_008921 [Puccinia striiformis f. sp. tritici PST-130]|nr:hypothetical protein KEM48_008921 [Puccinia striiformis f. sp. tritici PST-130]